MSYEHGTPFLNLAQTVGTDHRDWFDENEAKLDLDTKMKTLWDGAADMTTILATLQENVGTLQTDVTTLEGTVSGHTSSITTINESLVLINTALNALNTQVTNKFDSAGIADPYDATHGTYDVGDVVTYNGQRYVCNTAVTAAEPFDVSKWTAEDVQTAIELIANNVSFEDIIIPLASFTSGACTVDVDMSVNGKTFLGEVGVYFQDTKFTVRGVRYQTANHVTLYLHADDNITANYTNQFSVRGIYINS